MSMSYYPIKLQGRIKRALIKEHLLKESVKAIIKVAVVGWFLLSAALALAEDPRVATKVTTQTQKSVLGGLVSEVTTSITETITESVPITLNDVTTGSLLIKDIENHQYIEAVRVDTKVNIQVTGIIARVSVTQSFANPSDRWAEGLYAFPLPEDSAVDTLQMRIGEHVIKGQIQEKEQARKNYEQAKRQGSHASLVEQHRPNLFTTSVANIPPLDTVHIKISYLESIDYADGEFSLRFPLAITPRYSPAPMAAGMLPAKNSVTPVATGALNHGSGLAEIEVELNAGFKLAYVDSSSHDIELVPHDDDGVYSIRLTDVAVPIAGPLANDFLLTWQADIGNQPGAALFTENLLGETYALLMVVPPAVEDSAISMPRELVLIIDTSGSMAGTSFEQARQAVRVALSDLRSEDYFNLIAFDDATQRLFEHARPITNDTRRAALKFLTHLEADGGTNMAPALQAALGQPPSSGRLRQVVFITDGAVDNERELFKYVNDHLGESRLFTVGIGSSPNGFFMRKAAQFGRGTYTYISSVAQVGERMHVLFNKLRAPVLKNIDVSWSGVAGEIYPTLPPDLYHDEPIILSAKLDRPDQKVRMSGGLGGQLEGQFGQPQWQRTLEFNNGLQFRGVSSLWARQKIGSLMDDLSRQADTQRVRSAVVPLALKHHLVTQYTSLVAVDPRPARSMLADGGDNRSHSRRSHSSRSHFAGEQALAYPAGGTYSRLLIGVGITLLMLSLLPVLRRSK